MLITISIYLPKNIMISFFLNSWIIIHFVPVPCFHYPFISWWTSRLSSNSMYLSKYYYSKRIECSCQNHQKWINIPHSWNLLSFVLLNLATLTRVICNLPPIPNFFLEWWLVGIEVHNAMLFLNLEKSLVKIFRKLHFRNNLRR